jgi:protease I
MGSEDCVLMIVANHDFRDEEYSDIKDVLQAASIDVKLAALEEGECTGIGGLCLMTDIALGDADPATFDAVVLIKSFQVAGKIVSAICWAPAILANAGVLKGKRATVWDGAKDDLTENGAEYVPEHVVQDGKILTGDGPDVSMKFGEALVAMITQQAAE